MKIEEPVAPMEDIPEIEAKLENGDEKEEDKGAMLDEWKTTI